MKVIERLTAAEVQRGSDDVMLLITGRLLLERKR